MPSVRPVHDGKTALAFRYRHYPLQATRRWLITLSCLVSIFCTTAAPCAPQTDATIPALVDNGGYGYGHPLTSKGFRRHELFIPASTIKLITAMLALEQLGPQYRITTRLYLDGDDNLFVQGFGDPFLTSEAILELGHQIRQLGVVRINTLFLDDTSFAPLDLAPGAGLSANPYDAPNGAVAVNFNAVPIHKSKDGSISSGEDQTPLLPLMKELGKDLPPGHHRININLLKETTGLSSPLRYCGELLVAQFHHAGVVVTGGISSKPTPPGLQPILEYYSLKNVQETVRACLQFSNNFIANQLFLHCGMRAFHPPATWEKARTNLRNHLARWTLGELSGITIKDGAGLSRDNRLNVETLLRILERFKPYRHLLNRRDNVLLKSGTMHDVFCYAGYLQRDHTPVPFAILLNQQRNTRDQILHQLKKDVLAP